MFLSGVNSLIFGLHSVKMIHKPTLFDKIIRGEIPSYKVYEDAHVFAFLDVNPLSPGHTLVIPKESKAHLHELSDAAAGALGHVLPRICRAILKATGASDYNVLQNNGKAAGQAVFHVHFHIIPRFKDSGLRVSWGPKKLDKAEAEMVLEKICRGLKEKL